MEEGPIGGPYDCQPLNGLDGDVLVDELRPASVGHIIEVSHEHEVPRRARLDAIDAFGVIDLVPPPGG